MCYDRGIVASWQLSDWEKSRNCGLQVQVETADLRKDLRANLPKAVVNTRGFAKMIDQYAEPWNSHLGKEVLYQHVRLLVPYYSNAVSSDLKVLGKPALIIWGAQDEQNPVKYAERLQREIPGSQLVVVPNAGHL